MTNTDLTEFIDTSDEWIRERSGICARRISTEEGTSALAVKAAKRAIEDAGIAPEEIEIIVLATSSPDRAFPSAATDVQAAVRALNAVAFDITAACSGFIYGMHIVQGFIKSGIYKTGLVIGARRWAGPGLDRPRHLFPFGDGAGAAVVRADERGLIDTLVGSDGRKGWC